MYLNTGFHLWNLNRPKVMEPPSTKLMVPFPAVILKSCVSVSASVIVTVILFPTLDAVTFPPTKSISFIVLIGPVTTPSSKKLNT
ncbi:MAG: hypothetical protein IPO78_17655 [Saprospiraceae bacterium]|nr:hypothetical protein [Saprospiraceae bacterium]